MSLRDLRHSRRAILGSVGAGVAGLAARRGVTAQSATPEAGASPEPLGPVTTTPDEIAAIAEGALATYHLKSVIARVVVNGDEIATVARGESMNGVPATDEMHFRNGAVAISYISTALLVLVDRGVVKLDDTLDTWLPDLPDADKVTLKMLANLTAGYTDYVNTPGFVESNYLNAFRSWTPQEIIDGVASGLRGEGLALEPRGELARLGPFNGTGRTFLGTADGDRVTVQVLVHRAAGERVLLLVSLVRLPDDADGAAGIDLILRTLRLTSGR